MARFASESKETKKVKADYSDFAKQGKLEKVKEDFRETQNPNDKISGLKKIKGVAEK